MVDGAVVHDVKVSGGNRATFFEVLDFADVALANSLGVEGALGAVGDPVITELLGGNDGDKSEITRELMLENLVFGPGVNSVEDDALLAGGDEVFNLSDGLADDPILTFGLADHFAELLLAFAVGCALDAALLHFFVDHAAEVDFRDTTFGEVVDGDGFAAAAHADKGDDFNVSGICHKDIIA